MLRFGARIGTRPRPSLRCGLLLRPRPWRWPKATRRAVTTPWRSTTRPLAGLIRIGEGLGASNGRARILAELGIRESGAEPFVAPARFSSVVAADKLRASGMRQMFRSCGLGIPVVGSRCVDRRRPTEVDEQFYLPRLRVAATVLASPGGGLAGGAYRTAPLGLVYHDPFRVRSVRLGASSLPLATDRTTQLALQASQGRIAAQAFFGVFNSEFGPEVEPGLYLLRPYEPGKVPVVFVHGLSSSPVAFVQAINAFQNDPALASRYQFWMFVYPTGVPIVRSALRLREALGLADAAYGSDPAFGRMVVVGHSIGGILSHMIVSDSDREVWDAVLNVPPEQLRVSQATREALDELLFFRPLPYVRRVVFVATPHLGSPMANGPIGRVSSVRVRATTAQSAAVAEIRALNGPDAVRDENFAGDSINAIGNLKVDSPLLLAVSRLPVAPGVPYHTIAFRFAGHGGGDLIVPLRSARLGGAASEAVLPGNHESEQDPPALAEMRRILLEHLPGT